MWKAIERAVTIIIYLTEFSLSYDIEDFFSQSLDKIWKLHMKSYSYQRDQRITISSIVICIRMCKKNRKMKA